MSRIPDQRECVRMLVEEGCHPRVIRHCCRVMDAAVILAKRCQCDLRLVTAAALLHDIGRSRDHGIGHLREGLEILRRRGLHGSVIRTVQRHVGGGLDMEEARELGLTPGSYMPETIEEKVVAHADNLMGEDRVLSLQEVTDELKEEKLERAASRVAHLHWDLERRCGEDPASLLAREGAGEHLSGPCAAYADLR
ncbi:MAG: HDIG domain-containing metalloprotein [Methanomassiliicoccales archaeon]